MHRILDDYPAFASVIRQVLAGGVSVGGSSDLMALLDQQSRQIPLLRMDAWERAIRAEMRTANPCAYGPAWQFWSRSRRHCSWLDLCSHDGHQREAALRTASSGAASAWLLALAFRRLNDWVPEVRRAAREVIPALAASSAQDDVADVLWHLFSHWSSWGRLQRVDKELVLAIASSAPVAHSLRTKIVGATAGPAALVLSQCARSPAFDGWMVEFAEGSAQPAVRARAYRWLLLGQCAWVVGSRWTWSDLAYCKGKFESIWESRELSLCQPFVATLSAAIADRSPLVRRVGAEFLVREFSSLGEVAGALAHRMAADSNLTIAERGKFVLNKIRGSFPGVSGPGDQRLDRARQ